MKTPFQNWVDLSPLTTSIKIQLFYKKLKKHTQQYKIWGKELLDWLNQEFTLRLRKKWLSKYLKRVRFKMIKTRKE